MPRLVVAATSSGSGKTTTVLALLAAFRARGLVVQPFKIGPDYLDPPYLSHVAGREARNLDGFFLNEDSLRSAFLRGARGADLAIVEGVMGLFDGKDSLGEEASTAQMARFLTAPVVLVVDARAMVGSIAALARGFRDHDLRLHLGGVIANRVGSSAHAELLREALRSIGLPLLGYLLRSPELELPERRLGLVSPDEVDLDLSAFERAARDLDLETILALASSAPQLPEAQDVPGLLHPASGRLAVAKDPAFGFYYPESLELLAGLGAELVPFSPLADYDLPANIGGVYLGGGYPERYAHGLTANRGMRKALRRFSGPIFAECGGFMYLSEALVTPGGRFPMVGRVPGEARLGSRPILGYREVRAVRDSPLAKQGWMVRGHEFHYSTRPASPRPASPRPASPRPAWQLLGRSGTEGYAEEGILASYTHLYLPAYPQLAERWVGRLT